MLFDQLGHLHVLMEHARVPFVPDIGQVHKVVAELLQALVDLDLFLGQQGRGPLPQGRPAAIFTQGEVAGPGPHFYPLLVVDRAPECCPCCFFHGAFFFCDHREQKQDCHCANNDTS